MKRWQEIEDNKWKLTITPDDPADDSPPSVYRGTKEQIAEMLADSQANANRRISELKRNGQPGNGSAANLKPLSPADRLQTVAELTNPATVDTAITRVMESVVGPIEDERDRRQRDDQERKAAANIEAASAFAESTPEWWPSEHNKLTLVRFMQAQGMDPANQANYSQAFERLSAAELLQPKPDTDDINQPPADEPERNAPAPVPAPRATRISTGVTRHDISGTPPRPTTRLKYTREQLAEMSRETYKHLLLTDAQELARCEDYYAKNPVRRAG
jgi:hypothetical protein